MIGAGAKILGPVEVGEGARIAAGSVVLASVPAHVTVAGVPARIVGSAGGDRPSDAYGSDVGRHGSLYIENVVSDGKGPRRFPQKAAHDTGAQNACAEPRRCSADKL